MFVNVILVRTEPGSQEMGRSEPGLPSRGKYGRHRVSNRAPF